MKKKKDRSLDLLLEAIFEAENELAENDDFEQEEYSSYLKNILKEFLYKDENLLRLKLRE